MKKALALVLVLLLALSLCACGGNKEPAATPDGGADTPATPLKVVLIIKFNLGSQNFSDVADAGCKKAAAEFGVDYSCVENIDEANAADTMRAVINEGANVILSGQNTYAEAVEIVSQEYPDVMFCDIDSAGSGYAQRCPNVFEIYYKEHEASFLNAAFCALMSKSGKIAQLQGADSGTMIRFNSGFRAGGQYILGEDPVTVVVGFADVTKAYETSMLLYDQGVDWIACCAAASNLGVFQASEEKGGDYYCCGAADGQFHLMPERIVCSQVKRVDNVCYEVIKDAVNGNFKGGQTVQYGIEENGVDLIYNENNPELLKIIPDDVKTAMDDIIAKIASGELVVPATAEELAAFTARYEA